MVAKVSTCRFEEPLVEAEIFENDDSNIEWLHSNLAEKIRYGIPSSQGLWYIDDSLVRDDEGYVQVYEFEDFSFDILVPAHLRGRSFDIGTSDVEYVLSSICAKMKQCFDSFRLHGTYAFMPPPFRGTLLCKGRFEDNQGDYVALYWRVQAQNAASYLQHQADLELQEAPEEGASHGPGRADWTCGPGVAAGVDQAGPGVAGVTYEEGSRLQGSPVQQHLGAPEPSRQGVRHDDILSSRVRHPGV
ncbi:hypothetical protein VMCG_08173 [Cytospora schulzeri]|uniref:Uncharacterized protein n=1 Tax=Cytospora schulzeri TaxID=448051 RepID=A0A423VTV7_9PEZI|nr:hypothetical protein VMCG_08173 [Valsa malicola]